LTNLAELTELLGATGFNRGAAAVIVAPVLVVAGGGGGVAAAGTVVVVTPGAATPEVPRAWLNPCPTANLADGPISPTAINSMTEAPVIAAATIGLRWNMVELCKPIDRPEGAGRTVAAT
jgi:hypothetical protein